MIAIKNKHGLWYSGVQTYGNTPVFLVSGEFRITYDSYTKAIRVIGELEKKGIKDLKAVTVYPTHKQEKEEMSIGGMTTKRRMMLIEQQTPWSESENKKSNKKKKVK
jgi:hypothetical protein